jgi:hypothetical protein
MTMHCSRVVFLLGVFLLAGSPAVSAETAAREGSTAAVSGDAAPAPVLLAGGWGIGKWFSGSGGRARVVQFCVGTMCIALFIMMRKLN